MTQLISEKFQAALKHLLDKEGRGAQTRMATLQGIDRGYLNAILKGRVAGSDAIRSKIANHFETTFEDMLALGRQILEGKGELVPKEKDGVGQKAGTASSAIVTSKGESLKNSAPQISADTFFETIFKTIEVLQESSFHSDRLIGVIDVFHEAVVTNKINLALSNQLVAIESRVTNIEGVLSDTKAMPRKRRKAFSRSLEGK